MDALRLVVACSLLWFTTPVIEAKELGVVEDLSVGRHIISPFAGLGRYQNLLLRSEELDNASWVKSASTTISATDVTAPDGDADAEAVTFGSAGLHPVKQKHNASINS